MKGVYEIYCIRTGKRYIGSSKDIEKRWRWHIDALRRGNHHNYKLQKAFVSYGESEFIFSILELTEDDNALYEIEEKYISKFNFSKLYNAIRKPGEVPRYKSRWMQYCDQSRDKRDKKEEDEFAWGV